MGIRARVSLAQGLYYVGMGLWALFDLDSFYQITGPKTDGWLVKTVAALVVAVGVSLVIAARQAPGPEAVWLGVSVALGLFAIDCWYVWRDVISPLYLGDALVEGAFTAGWAARRRQRPRFGVIRRATPYWG